MKNEIIAIYTFLFIFALYGFIKCYISEKKENKAKKDLLEKISIYVDTKTHPEYAWIEHPGKIHFLKSNIVRNFTYSICDIEPKVKLEEDVEAYFTKAELAIFKELVKEYSRVYWKCSEERKRKSDKQAHIESVKKFDNVL